MWFNLWLISILWDSLDFDWMSFQMKKTFQSSSFFENTEDSKSVEADTKLYQISHNVFVGQTEFVILNIISNWLTFNSLWNAVWWLTICDKNLKCKSLEKKPNWGNELFFVIFQWKRHLDKLQCSFCNYKLRWWIALPVS